MIKNLRLQNFRRHAEADLTFDHEAQIVLIEGRNGAGKSSILEAIVMALYGEGRHGRKHLDNLTRRGAELEGMEVELTFEVGGATYRVARRRDGKASTAVLFANDVAIVEGPVAVTEEVTKILGMDAAGFRLAVIAQQKDIDALASLRPAERSQMIRRLLRLDAITAARDNAQTDFRRQRDLVRELRGGDELAGLRNSVADTASALSGAAEERARATDAISTIETELAASGDVDLRYEAAQRRRARAEERVSGERQEVNRLRQSLSGLSDADDTPIESVDLAALTAQVADIESRIAHSESTSRLREQRDVALGEISRVSERLEALANEKRDAEEAREEVARLNEELAGRLSKLEELDERVTALRNDLADATAQLNMICSKIERAESIDADCDTCGQVVPEDHRERHLKDLVDARHAAETHLNSTKESGRLAMTAAREERGAIDYTRTEIDKLLRRALAVDAYAAEQTDLERRLATYRKQVERLPESDVDTTPLLAERAALAEQIKRAVAANEQAAERMQRIERRNALTETLAAALERLGAAELDLERSSIPDELAEAKKRRVELDEHKASEQAMLNHWSQEFAVLTERHTNLKEALAKAEGEAARRAKVETGATVAANAARLLSDVADKLTAEMRPALEGSVSALLNTLSEGRFSSVRIDEDYSVTVSDDGSFRPMSEVSGGEADLIALAMRLALAQVVAERHGSGGAGFLILDEPFGSQDPGRREAILAALRQLRGIYRQIFLISHVENIEDAADMVVSVTTNSERTETEISVR